MLPVLRIIVAVVGVGIFAVGLLIVTAGGPTVAAGIWPLVLGGGIVIAAVLERQRYRSETADRTGEQAGPGGGEPAGLPPQFRPTEERFIDPTSGRVMRVFLDEQSGERRYKAEG